MPGTSGRGLRMLGIVNWSPYCDRLSAMPGAYSWTLSPRFVGCVSLPLLLSNTSFYSACQLLGSSLITNYRIGETKSTEHSTWSLCKSIRMCVSKEKWLGGSPSFPSHAWSSTVLSSIIFNDSTDSAKVSCVPQESSNIPALEPSSGMHHRSTPVSLLTSIWALVDLSSQTLFKTLSNSYIVMHAHLLLALQPPLRPNNQWDFTMEYYAGKFVIWVVILTVCDGTWTMCWVDFAGFISISTLTFNIWGTCSLVNAVLVGSCVLVVEDYCSKINWRTVWSKTNHNVIFRS